MNLMGGFGNVLFQFMYGYSVARKNKAQLFFICNEQKRQNASKYKFMYGFNVDNLFNYKYIRMNEKNHYYDEYTFNSNNNYVITGYFQSYKYSKQYFNEINQIIFNNLSDKIKKIDSIYESIKKDNKITITLHIRRTDYIDFADVHYVVRTDNWYENAIKILLTRLKLNKDDIKLILFSDDVKYLENMEITKEYNNIIAEKYNLDIEETFLLMSNSDHFIIPNSSYSLMAYYFRRSNNANIVIPNNWFREKGPSYKMEDIIEMTENVIIQNV
jgi:hypothetical protein